MKKGLLLMLSIILMLTMCKKKEEITCSNDTRSHGNRNIVSDMRRRGD